MSIKEKIEYNVCIFIHKMVIGECPSYLKSKIDLVAMDGRVQTRQKGNREKTKEEQKMLLYDGFIMYNGLPNEIRKEEKPQSFQRALVPYIKSRKGSAIMEVPVDKELYTLVHLLFNLDLDVELDFK